MGTTLFQRRSFIALFFVLACSFAHPASAMVLQGVYSASGSNQDSNYGFLSQAFSGITSPLESVSVYVSRKDTDGSASSKFFNIYRVRCFTDSALTSLCPASGLDGSGYVLWNNQSLTNFINTSTAIPQTADQYIGQNTEITVPFDSQIKMTIPIVATTTHSFNPAYFYNFEWTEVLAGADAFYFYGSPSNVYAPTNLVPATTTSPYIVDMYFEVNEGTDSGETLATTSTTQIPKNIEILNPTYGTTTATTTYTVEAHFKTPFSLDFRPTTTRAIYITDALTEELEWYDLYELPAGAAQDVTITRTATSTTGSKYVVALYLDQNGHPYSEIDMVFFNVVDNTYLAATGVVSPQANANDLTQIDCDAFSIGCQFQKAMTFLFTPQQGILDAYANLWQTISTKRPFGYFTVVMEQLKGLNTTASSAFTFGDVPFADAIFTPLRTALAVIVWVLFAVFFYRKRLVNLDI